MRVLVACEFSGVVREAFRSRGHEAWSCVREQLGFRPTITQTLQWLIANAPPKIAQEQQS